MAAITSTVAVCSPCAVVTRRPAVATQRVAALARPAFVGSALPQRSFAVAKQSRQQRVRATGRTPPPAVEDDTTIDVEGLVKDLQEKWDGVENKTSVAIYAGGAVVLLWFSSTIVSAVNSVPLLPKLLELVGLGYSAWFVYRYLLFKSSREELIADVEELKKKISGAVEDNTS